MIDLPDEAEALARALEVGALEPPEVVAWAVAKIETLAAPHWTLCEVATADRSYPQDIASLLRQIPGTRHEHIARCLVVQLLEARLRNDGANASSVASSLYAMWMADGNPSDELGNLSSWAWDALDLAASGTIVETTDEVVAEMLKVLSESVERCRGEGMTWSRPWSSI